MRVARLLPFLFSLLVLSAAAQPPASEGNRTDAEGRKQGSWSKSWPNGKLRYQGRFVDDKPTGEFKHYDEEGALTTVQRHAGDGHVSRAEHFHPSGTLMATGKYVDQRKDSTWNYYAPDGGLSKVERYKAGELDGEQVTYYSGGAVAEKELRLNGLLQGESKSWFANGNLKSEANYVKGEPEGRMTFYYPSGKKEIEGNSVNGDRDGAWMYYNEDGTVQVQVLYAKGEVVKEKKENGTFKEYYDDDQLKSEVTYRKGLKEGAFTEYYDNGKWEVKPVPADPIKGTPADVERVLTGQTKKREGAYKADLLEGEVKTYDEKGKVVKVTRYVAGVEQ